MKTENSKNPALCFLTEAEYVFNPRPTICYYSADKKAVIIPGLGPGKNMKNTYLFAADEDGKAVRSWRGAEHYCAGKFAELLNEEERKAFAQMYESLTIYDNLHR